MLSVSVLKRKQNRKGFFYRKEKEMNTENWSKDHMETESEMKLPIHNSKQN